MISRISLMAANFRLSSLYLLKWIRITNLLVSLVNRAYINVLLLTVNTRLKRTGGSMILSITFKGRTKKSTLIHCKL